MKEKKKKTDHLLALIREGRPMTSGEQLRLTVGLLRPITLWPFPSAEIARLSRQVKGILSFEINAGQMVEDILLATNGRTPVAHYGRMGGVVPAPDEVIQALKEKLIK